jgi:hypothetical protein
MIMEGSSKLTAERLLALLGLNADEQSIEICVEFALDNAKEIVKNYCHIDEIPAELETTVLRMAMDIYRNEKPGELETPQRVSSVQIGDTSTSFGTVSASFTDSLMKNYKSSLNRYRKVVFT